MSKLDVISACNEFYHKCGTIKDVVEELALPYELVSNAVKLPRCPPEIKKAVEKGEIKLKTAIKATNALKWDQDKSETNQGSKVLELAKRLEDNIPRELQKAVVEVGKSDPAKSVDDIVKEAESVKITPIKITFGNEEHVRLNKFADDEEIDEEEAAANLILDGLNDRGY